MSQPTTAKVPVFASEAVNSTPCAPESSNGTLQTLVPSQRVPAHMHPRRAHIHESRSFGERAADMVAAGLGSWRFIGVQSGIILVWIAWNSFSGHAFDPFPWILLNLLFSTQAAYAAPILQLSGNRQAAKDRTRDDTEAAEVEQLTGMNEQQLVILAEVRAQAAQIADLKRLLMDASTASVKDPKTGRFVSRKTTPLTAS